MKPALAAAGPEFLAKAHLRIFRHLFFEWRKQVGGAA
jgi:hypothetical protein